MSLPKSIRLERNLESKVKKYLRKNNLKFSQFISLAIEKFISEPHTITLEPLDTDKYLESVEKAYKQHEDAMDKLK